MKEFIVASMISQGDFPGQPPVDGIIFGLTVKRESITPAAATSMQELHGY
ncbi:MAG: hypothetical protein WCJ26_00755 [bacterium]